MSDVKEIAPRSTSESSTVHLASQLSTRDRDPVRVSLLFVLKGTDSGDEDAMLTTDCGLAMMVISTNEVLDRV